mmetsp:Transcript_42830/g.64803  ORF Transcript_42830/g.64803 Transcript_42830/m.64803 type:complete len:512 (+) Transcript_42830:15-1550(+)
MSEPESKCLELGASLGSLAIDAGVVPLLVPVEGVDVLHLLWLQRLDGVEGLQELLEAGGLGEDDVAQHLVLGQQQVLQVGRGVSGMARRVHHQATGVGLATLQGDLDGGGDAVGVLGIKVGATVGEVDLLHQGTGGGVEEGLLTVVLGSEHQGLPGLLVGGGNTTHLDGLLKHPRNNEGHAVVGALAGLGVLLGRVTDDAEGRLVGHNVDVVDALGTARGQLGVVHQGGNKALQGTSRLMLVQAQLEVHTTDSEVGSAVRQDNVEGAGSRAPSDLVAQGDVDVVLAGSGASGGLEESEDGLGVAEDVLGADEAVHGAPHGEHSCLGGDGSRGTLGIGKLLASSDGSEWDIVGHGHTDGALDLLGGGSQQGSVDSRRGDGTVDDVVDLVGLEREDLCQAASDLVQADHGPQCLLAADITGHLGGSDDDAVEVVVAEFAGGVAGDGGIVTEDCAVGVPLANCGGVGDDGLLRRNLHGASEALGALGIRISQGLLPQAGGGVGLHGQSRDTAHH